MISVIGGHDGIPSRNPLPSTNDFLLYSISLHISVPATRGPSQRAAHGSCQVLIAIETEQTADHRGEQPEAVICNREALPARQPLSKSTATGLESNQIRRPTERRPRSPAQVDEQHVDPARRKKTTWAGCEQYSDQREWVEPNRKVCFVLLAANQAAQA